MQLKWLEDFICLNEQKSFRLAAEQRNVSQSAYSRRIQALEEWVGTTLVDRSSYPLQLTLAGNELVSAATEISAAVYQAKKDVIALHQNTDSEIILATHPSLAITTVPNFLKTLSKPVEDITYHIRNDLMAAELYLSSLSQGTCDYLICYQHEATKFSPEKELFHSQRIGTETLTPIMAAGTDVNSQPMPLVNYSPYTNLGKVINHTLQSKFSDTEFRKIAEASVADTVKAMVLSGHGLAWLPSSLIQRELQEQSLTHVNRFASIEVDIVIYRHINLRKNALFIWNQLTKL